MITKKLKKGKNLVTVSIGGGFKKKPKLMRFQGRWYPVGSEEWKLLRSLEVDEIRLKKKKAKKII